MRGRRRRDDRRCARPRAIPARAAWIALGALAGCAAPLKPDEPKAVVALAIHPYETHEQCAHLAPDDRLEYAFEATEPIAFDIRYHEGSVVVAPIVRESTRGDAGVFVARVTADFASSGRRVGARGRFSTTDSGCGPPRAKDPVPGAPHRWGSV